MDCAAEGASRLTDTHYAILFDVDAYSDGQVRAVKIKDSILRDAALESCMANALQSMSVPQSITARRSPGLVSPQSRRLSGNVVVLGGAITLSPILLIAAGVTIIVGVTIYVLTDASTATRDATDEDAEKERCQKVLDMCIEKCTEETIPSGTLDGDPFFKCRRQCLEAHNCWGKRLY